MMHGWQSESTDRPEGGCDFWNGLQWSPHPQPQLQDAVWCSEVLCNFSCSCSGEFMLLKL